MKKSLLIFTILSLLIALISGCGEKTYKPVAINEETDKCEICNMQVKDDAFAVQLTTKEGKTYKFDDLGCMNEWKQKNGTVSIGASFVRDFNNKEWIDYDDAAYVYDPSLKSPMAYGIYSFKDQKSAQAFIDEQKKGKLLTASDLKNHSWKQNTDMMKPMDMSGHDEKSHSSADAHTGTGMDMKGKP
ncbi:nitrous oxide reductase accessory protein NosL [Paenibacillus sp. MBLB4367]|uniref:nitrous oxide reductase accessory protein NosL n=1 Tax=Paenibacillus sp. MBLB4367 TaxID=3384767 RepID=UPI0039084066